MVIRKEVLEQIRLVLVSQERSVNGADQMGSQLGGPRSF